MTETIITYLKIGWEHIISTDALDHQLFLIALIWPFSIREYRSVLILITAFTIGHSITLALSSSGAVRISSGHIEFLIPVSIFITAGTQILPRKQAGGIQALFGMTGLFGLLHGLGFAGILRQVLGKEDSILLPLLGFNAGVESGQIAIVSFLFSLKIFLGRFEEKWTNIAGRIIMISVLLGSLWMIWQRFPQ